MSLFLDRLYTVPRIARETGSEVRRVEYVIRSLKLPLEGYAGGARVSLDPAVGLIARGGAK